MDLWMHVYSHSSGVRSLVIHRDARFALREKPVTAQVVYSISGPTTYHSWNSLRVVQVTNNQHHEQLCRLPALENVPTGGTTRRSKVGRSIVESKIQPYLFVGVLISGFCDVHEEAKNQSAHQEEVCFASGWMMTTV